MKKSKKVLVVANNGPESSFGGGQRNILIGKLMEQQGYEVEMVLLIDINWGTYSLQSDFMKKWNNIFPILKLFQPDFSKPFITDFKVFNFLKKIQSEYEWIIFRYEKTAFKAGFFLLNRSRVIIDFDDFIVPNAMGIKFVLHYIRHIFQYIRTSKCFFVNQMDKKYFKEKAIWVPNIPLADYFPSPNCSIFSKNLSEYPLILHFVSDYDTLTDFFVSNQFSNLIRKLPNLKFIFICRKLDKKFKSKFKIYNIEWIENPEEVDVYFVKAWASLILEKKHQGTHVKFIESIFYFTPVIGFNEAFRGYEMFFEQSVNVPMSYEDICNQIYLIGSNEEYTLALSKKNKIVQCKYFSLNNLSNKLRILKYE